MKFFICNLFLVAFLVCLSVNYASSFIVCYVCEGFGSNAACRNRLDASMVTVCKEPESYCGYVKLDHVSFVYTKRGCGQKFDENDDILEDYAKKTGTRVSPTLCNTNLCNKTIEKPITGMILFISAMLFLSFLFLCLFMSIKNYSLTKLKNMVHPTKK